MKKTITLILILILTAALMAGCSLFGESDKSASVTDDSGKKIETEKAPSAEKNSEADNDKPSDKESSKNKSSRKAAEKASGKKVKEKAATKKAKERKASKKGREKAASKKKAKDSAQKKKEKRKAKQSAKKKNRNASSNNNTAAQKTCTIKITCHRLVENSALDEAQRARVPSDGIIMSSVKIRIEDGDSVYDVLKRACKEKGIVLAAENTSLGIYVAGIDGFYEKDAGSESGWKYKVNGNYPNDSAGDVKVKDGDIIEWEYALEA